MREHFVVDVRWKSILDNNQQSTNKYTNKLAFIDVAYRICITIGDIAENDFAY